MNLTESIRKDLNIVNETLASQRKQLLTPEEILSAIKEYDNEDEIMNADFKHIKDEIGYRFRKTSDLLQDTAREYQDDATRALYFAWPSNPCSWTRTMKALKDVPHKEVVEVYTQQYNTWKEICDGMKALKPKIVKTATKRAEKKDREEAELEKKKTGDFAQMIKLLEANRNEYIAVARDRAEEYKNYHLKKLEMADMNLDVAVPERPGEEYREYKNRTAIYTALTDPAWKGGKSPSDPDIRERNPKREEKWMQEQIEIAEANYDSFIKKMIQKIGEPVTDAKLEGSIWENATLTVTTVSGETQVWKTKIIINFSKFGKMFNQFPTRRKN